MIISVLLICNFLNILDKLLKHPTVTSHKKTVSPMIAYTFYGVSTGINEYSIFFLNEM